MQQTSQPSLKKILLADQSTLIVVIFPVAAWLLLAMQVVMLLQATTEGKALTRLTEGTRLSLIFGVVGTVFAVLFVILRMRGYQRFFSQGVEVQGRITSTFMWRGRTSIRYTYDYMGQSYKGKASVMSISARGLRQGTDVVLLVDYQEPKRSLIREFYV